MGLHSLNRFREPISRPLLAAILAVILLGGGAIAWIGLGDRIDDESPTTAAPGGCLEGASTVPIIADPGVAPALQEIAQNYNAQKPVVRDHCVEIAVRPGDARATLDGLRATRWDTAANGPHPAAWVPESSIWAAALTAGDADAVQGTAESLVTSPVLLAVRPEMASTAGTSVMWVQVPYLTYADSFSAYGHRPLKGSIRLAMPQGPQSAATSLAAQAFAANTVSPDEASPLTVAGVRHDDVQVGLKQLMRDPPSDGDGSAEAAVQAIIDAESFSDASIRSVPISEQRLYLATKDHDEARIGVIRPHGFTPKLDYPMIRLTDGVEAYASDAAAEFLTFARKPAQMKVLTQAGFRGTGPLPEATATIGFPEVKDEMPAAEPAAVLAVNRIVLPAAAPRSK
ncbi:MAG: substrate-binding domain-containing protein [Gordonia sp. (in: high G+C Gram-positive bacteria)]|uniref:substrate-binding domain-containing protein n=1 Tax=Gordonia sp. (in: high G+C Gram-positive bacteria) TaxID=84139 RepID=UPI0039E51026